MARHLQPGQIALAAQHLLEARDSLLLATHNTFNRDSALAAVDSSILEACKLLDTPVMAVDEILEAIKKAVEDLKIPCSDVEGR